MKKPKKRVIKGWIVVSSETGKPWGVIPTVPKTKGIPIHLSWGVFETKKGAMWYRQEGWRDADYRKKQKVVPIQITITNQ